LHVPPWQESPTVQTLPSEQVLVSSGVPMQPPVWALHVSSVHELPSSQPLVALATHTPVLSHEPMWHALSSEQVVLAGITEVAHEVALTKLQVLNVQS
jgi:hypothetical protein